MICIGCNVEREQKDFVGDKCFKCVYKQKKKIALNIRKCKRCDVDLPSSRWIFCSDDCLVKFSKENAKKHWTESIHKSYSPSWKENRLNFKKCSNPKESSDF